jgi:hypothetical protein
MGSQSIRAVRALVFPMRSFLVCSLLLAGSLAHADSAKPVAKPVTGIIVERPTGTIHCGVLHVWTVIHIDASKDPNAPRGPKVDAARLPVAVSCIELVKPAIAKGDRITVTLDGPKDSGAWGKQTAWVATTIQKL